MKFEVGNNLGKRWQKGQSGNPAGRSKIDFDLAEAARVHSAEMLDIAVGIARDGRVPPESRLRAVEIVLSRGHGRPLQAVAIDAEVRQKDATTVFIEALRAHNEQLRMAESPPLLPAAEQKGARK